MHTTSPPEDAHATPDRTGAVPTSLRRVACCGVSTADHGAEAVGDLAPAEPRARAGAVASHERITEAVVLATCNRVEVYVSARRPADRETALAVALDALGPTDDARTWEGVAAVDHLACVAAGLDSEILGEDHVLGQVNRTFDEAAEAGLAGGVLSRVADAAVAVGRDVREETAINEGQVGYGSAACEAIAEGGPEPDRLVVVGAGDIAESVVRASTHRWNARIDVVNRSPAPDLPSAEGRDWPLADLSAALAGADAVVTATGATEPVLTADAAATLAAGTPVVDLGAPPDVAETVSQTVAVTSLSAIQSRVDASTARRRDAVPAVEERVDAAVERFLDRERESRAEDAIRQLHRQAASVRRSELERALRRIEAGDEDVETVVEDFASALTSRLLADPTAALRDAAREGDDETVAAARRLFDAGEDDQ